MADLERVRYACGKPGRRLAVAGAQPPVVNGIDFLEVANTAQTVLSVFFLFPLPGETDALPPAPAPTLTADNLLIEGGERIVGVKAVTVDADKARLDVTVDQPGDFSTYTLRLVDSVADAARRGVPTGFDPMLAAVDFSFKAACPSDFDCRNAHACPPETHPQPAIDYLAKDYASFRKLMLDRLAVVTPDWTERNPADLGVAVVEALAYVADELSYYQDAVATEAYLSTARQRISVRRHARLLDYRLHEGCNARAFVCLEVDAASAADGAPLPRGQSFASLPAPATLAPADLAGLEPGTIIVFEAFHPLTLHAAHNRLDFYTWSDAACCLPKGATRATLADPGGTSLKAGAFVAFEEILSPTAGTAATADPAKRHVVRLSADAVKGTDPLTGQAVLDIAWGQDDALPFPLCLTAEVVDAGGSATTAAISVVRANVVLTDHGQTIAGETLIDAGTSRQQLHLARPGLTWAAPWAADTGTAATRSLVNDPRQALPAVQLDDGQALWTPRLDLLASDRFAREFVVETDNRGRAFLRFGDGELGAAPPLGADFTANYRIGNGTAGNVGREAIGRAVTTLSGIYRVWNPLPASGGIDAESLDHAKADAPQAFRTQERAVTADDYQRVAELHPEVQRAKARFRWTGSWLTVFITVDRLSGKAVDGDPAFAADLLHHLDRYRMAGYDLELLDPVFAPLDLKLFVCVKPASFKSDVRQALNALFSSRVLASGEPAFFHPDRFSFGDSLYLSRVVAAAMAVEGVASVELKRFKRQNRKAAGELAAGVIAAGAMEILRLDNDPNFPERGKIEFVLEGGL